MDREAAPRCPARIPSVPLALEDFVPVVVTAIGLSFVVAMLRRVHPASGSWAALGAALRLILARWARGLGRPGIAALFLVSLAVTLGLNGLARAEVQSEPLQWAEQLLNSLNQGVFMLAALRLERATRPDMPPVPAEAPVAAPD